MGVPFLFEEKRTMSDVRDLIIVGGGPAGVSAGIYAARQNLDVLMITKDFGGQINQKAVKVGNYPGFLQIEGSDLVKRMREHLESLNVPFETDSVGKIRKEEGIFLLDTKEKKVFKSKAVIVASGADPRPIEVPGEKEFLGKGVSYCAVCDGPFFKGKIVAVIGGGNVAFETALALSSWVEKIYLFECSSKIKAEKFNQELLEKTGKAEVIVSTLLKEIKGGKMVESVVLEEKESSKTYELKVEGVFIEIGLQPATFFVKDLADFSASDEIKIDPKTCETRTAGLFAAGDATDVKYKQIVVACGEGAKAALSAISYLGKMQ
jgi:thioredoxin-disulfide reductase